MSEARLHTLAGMLHRASNEGVGRAPPGVTGSEGGLGLRFVDRKEEARYLPYGELWRQSCALARGLLELGITRGERVALILPTSEEFPIAFFGAMIAGVIPVPLYPPVRLGRIDEYHRRTASMLDRVEASLVLTDERIRRVLGGTFAHYRARFGCRTVAAAMSGSACDDALPWEQTAPEAFAFVQFSSGTVSEPKPIALTHRQVLANTDVILSELLGAYPESETFVHSGVSWLPLYHDMGLVGCLMVAVRHPGELTLIPPELFVADPALWLRTISRYRGTISPAPNFAYSLCAERVSDDALEGADLSCWKAALNGAEPVTPAVLERFVERFSRCGFDAAALTPVYGLAEATLALTFASMKEPFATRHFFSGPLVKKGQAAPAAADDAETTELVSVGRPLPGFAVRVVDDADRTLPEGQVGRIWARGPSLMRGYLGRPDLDAATFRDGWLDTGDLGFFSEGQLFLYGRAKDIIIINGRNMAPQELELALDEIDAVRKGCSAAVGIVLEAGERLHVFVEVERAYEGEFEDLGDTIAARIATFGLGRAEIVLLAPGTLPRTSSGKIRRAETRRRHLGGELSPPKRVGPLLIARELLRGWVPGRMKGKGHG